MDKKKTKNIPSRLLVNDGKLDNYVQSVMAVAGQ